MQDILVVLIVFSVPLAAIVGRTYLKAKQLQLEAGKLLNPEIEVRLMKLAAENEALRARVETLETIATGGDSRSSGIEAARKLEQLEAVNEAEKAFKR